MRNQNLDIMKFIKKKIMHEYSLLKLMGLFLVNDMQTSPPPLPVKLGFMVQKVAQCSKTYEKTIIFLSYPHCHNMHVIRTHSVTTWNIHVTTFILIFNILLEMFDFVLKFLEKFNTISP